MSTLSVPENLFHLIEQRARNQGTTVDAQVAELLAKALAEIHDAIVWGRE
jgi:hypothetical protein